MCEFGGDDCVKAPSVVDRTAHKYSDRLIQRVEEIYNQLKIPCNLADLPKVPTKPLPTQAPEPPKVPKFKGQFIGEITNGNGFGDNAKTHAPKQTD